MWIPLRGRYSAGHSTLRQTVPNISKSGVAVDGVLSGASPEQMLACRMSTGEGPWKQHLSERGGEARMSRAEGESASVTHAKGPGTRVAPGAVLRWCWSEMLVAAHLVDGRAGMTSHSVRI